MIKSVVCMKKGTAVTPENVLAIADSLENEIDRELELLSNDPALTRLNELAKKAKKVLSLREAPGRLLKTLGKLGALKVVE